jgi:hypothetical protein
VQVSRLYVSGSDEVCCLSALNTTRHFSSPYEEGCEEGDADAFYDLNNERSLRCVKKN